MQDYSTSPSPAPIDYFHMIVRRKWVVAIGFFTSVLGAGILCVVLPESYRSQTLILVEGQKVPENYVKAIGGPSIEERLNSIQQQVMSRTLLTHAIQEFNLYPDVVRGRYGIETAIEQMRKDVTVTTIGARSSRGGIDAFTISFAHENPVLAMKVTAKLASHFIEENLKLREQLVEGTSEFLEQELGHAKERLEDQERAISQFKQKYMGELPGQLQANISTLDRLQLQLGTTTEALQKASDRLTLIEKSIKEYEATGATVPGAVQKLPGNPPGGDPLILRLRELEKNLATLKAEYKDTYPDIVQLKQEIEALKQQLRDKSVVKEDSTRSEVAQKEAQPADPYLREMSRQREEARLEIASLKDRLVRTREQMREYETRVEKAPAREQELMMLVRDEDNLKANYQSLLEKKMNARLLENLEKRQKGEQFRIVDPANLPSKPDKPDRQKIMLVGLLLGCGLGAGSAIGLEMLRPVFRRSEDVERALQLRVIAAIPSFKNIIGEAHKRVSPGVATSSREARGGLLPSSLSAGERNGEQKGALVAQEKAAYGSTATHRSRGAIELREFELIGKWSPWSTIAEQFRVAATRLALLQSSNAGKVTVVTSAIKGEGKSVVAANLAYTLARDMGKLTLLIDGDLKCPTVHRLMGISQAPGLRDLIQGTHSVESCLRQEGELPLWILPSGIDRGRAVDDLSRIRQVAAMLGELKKRYEYILIDAPPVLPLADMQVIAGMADTVAFVIRAGLTPRSVVENALRTLGETNTNSCIILNELEARGVPYYMQEGYQYFAENK